MPVKLRLQRKGRKRRPYYHIVAADARAKRDGKYIERIGFYDPNHEPAKVGLDSDAALKWLHNGAQPTDTVRSILKKEGVLYRKHLARGVRKGALTEEQSKEMFQAYLAERRKEEVTNLAPAPFLVEEPVAEAVEEVVVIAEEVAAEETPAAEGDATTEEA